jgi:hypothetical protein
LDYERLLCATGPYEGEILRASDKKHPHNIARVSHFPDVCREGFLQGVDKSLVHGDDL